MITDYSAKLLASLWHGGLHSGLYAIACNDAWDKLSRADWIKAYNETIGNWRDAVADKDRVNERECIALKDWIKAKAASYGHSVKL